jgi:hypothetical protein
MHTNSQCQRERERIQKHGNEENILCLNICFVVNGTTKPGEERRRYGGRNGDRKESEYVCVDKREMKS